MTEMDVQSGTSDLTPQNFSFEDMSKVHQCFKTSVNSQVRTEVASATADVHKLHIVLN